MTRLPVVLAAAAMLPATAHAWKHSDPYFAWLPEDMPIPYVTQAECEDNGESWSSESWVSGSIETF